jgi:hypothetical protein
VVIGERGDGQKTSKRHRRKDRATACQVQARPPCPRPPASGRTFGPSHLVRLRASEATGLGTVRAWRAGPGPIRGRGRRGLGTTALCARGHGPRPRRPGAGLEHPGCERRCPVTKPESGPTAVSPLTAPAGTRMWSRSRGIAPAVPAQEVPRLSVLLPLVAGSARR